MRKTKIRLALVGTSAFSRSYVNAARKCGAEISWIHSRTLERAKDFGNAYKLPGATDNLSAILEDDTTVGAVICTEPGRHIDLAESFLEKGKHVLIEKPLDSDLSKAKSFYKKYKNSPLVISVSAPKRFDPVLNKMKQQFKEKKDTDSCVAIVSMLWSRSEAYYQSGGGWKTTDAPVLSNQAIHWIDVCHWFFGEVQSITSSSITTKEYLSCANQSLLILKYKNNTQVSLIATTALNKQHADKFDIYFSDKKISYEELLNKTKFKNRLLRHFQSTPVDQLLKNFIYAIREGVAPLTNLESGLKAMETAYTASQID